MRPVIHVKMKVPIITVEIAFDPPATSIAILSESNWMKAAIAVATAVTAGPKYGTRCTAVQRRRPTLRHSRDRASEMLPRQSNETSKLVVGEHECEG